jgi:Zn finger protein HypA/HybF involved in hydrogenase expression
MSVLQANCPSCAAQIEFTKGSTTVLVCPFCRSAVSRTDRKLEDLGKVAEILDSQSPLRIGLKGEYFGQRFELTGRAQLQHSLGGFWDEWYANFGNGWVGWLAEAQGKFYMTFYQPLGAGEVVPDFDFVQVGQAISFGKNAFVVAEKGIATSLGADGEIPYQLVPNERNSFADLQGKDHAFGTIDYSSNPPFVFVGKEVTLADIGLANARPAERKAASVSTQGMGCPNCGGPINLQVPDKSERVTCPNCDSLLDVNQGNLSWLKSLQPSPDAHQFDLQIGAEGTFADGKKMKILGAVVRSVTIEGIKYFWHEYLLYNPTIGFRWLIHSDNHWNFVEPVNIAEVTGSGTNASFGGKSYKVFQDAPAVVEYVKGEFYWRVEAGETVRAIDYVKAPLMLSSEITGSEVNWSIGTYTPVADIEKAFGIIDLPKPWNVAPNQPFGGWFYVKYGFAMLGILLIISIFMIPFTGNTAIVMSESVTLQPPVAPAVSQIAFSQPFEIKANRNVQITASAPVNNSFVELDVDLINDANDEVESVTIPIEFYSGVDEGESWSEGGQSKDVAMSSIPGGKYTLRIEGTWQNAQQPMPISVKVEQGVTRGLNFCCAFIILLLLPLVSLIRYWMFESSRWSESMFSSSGSSSSEDSDDSYDSGDSE